MFSLVILLFSICLLQTNYFIIIPQVLLVLANKQVSSRKLYSHLNFLDNIEDVEGCMGAGEIASQLQVGLLIF
jgi:hypothetical protein